MSKFAITEVSNVSDWLAWIAGGFAASTAFLAKYLLSRKDDELKNLRDDIENLSQQQDKDSKDLYARIEKLDYVPRKEISLHQNNVEKMFTHITTQQDNLLKSIEGLREDLKNKQDK